MIIRPGYPASPLIEAACAAVPRDQWSDGQPLYTFVVRDAEPIGTARYAAIDRPERPGPSRIPRRRPATKAQLAGARVAGDLSRARTNAKAMEHGPQIYARYAAGQRLSEIAEALGYNRSTISDWLRRYCAANDIALPSIGERRRAIIASVIGEECLRGQ
jgi:hypothetical protein